jgi:hypothetical protein
MRLPHQYVDLNPAIRREIAEWEPPDGWPLHGITHRPPGPAPEGP